MSSASLPRPCTRPGVTALGSPAAGADHEHRVAVQHELVRAGRAPRPPGRGARRPAGSPASCARRTAPARAAGAGRPRTPPTSAAMSPGVRGDGRDPALAHDQVGRRVAGQHGDPAGRQPLREGSGDPGHPALDRPGAEPLLDVRRRARPGRDVAQVVALGDERVRGDQSQPLVLEAAAQPLVQRLAAVQARRELAWQVVGSPGHLEVVAAQHVPVVGVRRRRARPSARRGRARARRTPPSCAARDRRAPGPTSRPRTGARGPRSSGTSSQLPLQRPPGLAEQVAHHCRQQRVRAGRRPRRTRPARRRSARRPSSAIARPG